MQYGIIIKPLISAVFFVYTYTKQHFSHCYRHSLFGTNVEFIMLPYFILFFSGLQRRQNVEFFL